MSAPTWMLGPPLRDTQSSCSSRTKRASPPHRASPADERSFEDGQVRKIGAEQRKNQCLNHRETVGRMRCQAWVHRLGEGRRHVYDTALVAQCDPSNDLSKASFAHLYVLGCDSIEGVARHPSSLGRRHAQHKSAACNGFALTSGEQVHVGHDAQSACD